jgi:hypothetical protein
MKYEAGDYIKVEFPDEVSGVGEWMWVRVTARNDAKRLVFGTLDNAPVNDATGKLNLGKELAISFDRIREHRKPLRSSRDGVSPAPKPQFSHRRHALGTAFVLSFEHKPQREYSRLRMVRPLGSGTGLTNLRRR